jgi:hypothetical protein
MKRGYYLIGGGVQFAQSTVAFGPMFASKSDIERMLETDQANRAHVVVPDLGYQVDSQNWPKPGFFCQKCLAVLVKISNR